MKSPHSLKRIRLELARSKDHPSGSTGCGYEFIAPLDRHGHIDSDAWKHLRQHCTVRRFWQGAEDKQGYLVHKPGGSEHAHWTFDYDKTRLDDDEAGYRFGAHAFVPGDYVTVSDQNAEHTFRVASVEVEATTRQPA
jgi:hypothetical protein